MEIVIFTVCTVASLGCLSANLLIAYMVWQHFHDKREKPVKVPEETPEEKEARRVAMEAQRLYDQSFIDMMNYMGKPPKKERD